jgi:formylglycine-generating enzyme required for sulfatase activity
MVSLLWLVGCTLISDAAIDEKFEERGVDTGTKTSTDSGKDTIAGTDTSTVRSDSDNDGVPASDDCDDNDPELGTITSDHDCDGAIAAQDCDDYDATSTTVASDGDCDGVLAVADCDDADAMSTIVSDDGDCDAVRTADDCDDTDVAAGPTYAGSGCMMRVSAGLFDVGCTAGQTNCDGDESPVMAVTLTSDFFIGRTEVTQAEYETLMGYNPSYFSSCGPTCPVETVSWHMAAAFANAASAAAGLTECYTCVGSDTSLSCSFAVDPYTCDGYRLPTEAEWEGAARCGTDFRYAGSDTLGDVGWYIDNSGSTSHPAEGRNPNICGLYDMSGNVWEWTHDWYSSDYYISSGRTDPSGPSTGIIHVARGGGWNYQSSYVRVAVRGNGWDPNVRNVHVGFRIARSAHQ